MSNDEARSLGDHVKQARIAAGYASIRSLALATGISHGYLAKLERGEAINPSMDALQKIAAACSVDLQELFRDAQAQSEGSLPELRVYFRRKLGVNPDQADVLATLVEKYQQGKEEKGPDEETD